MLNAIVLPLVFGLHTGATILEYRTISQEPLIYIAKKHKGEGPDHGDDPNDEQHDDGIPARGHRNDHRPPSDPYAGTIPNDKNPY